MLEPSEPDLPLSQQLAKLYTHLGYLTHIKWQSMPKPLPSTDPQLSIKISEYLHVLLAEHAIDLMFAKQTLKRA